MLRVPFTPKANVLPESGVSVYFTNDTEIASIGEIVLTEASEYSGTVELWQDGTKLVDEFIDETPENSSGTAVPAAFNWSVFNDCLASNGIAAWAITAIGVACGAACVATVGLGCIVCATSIAGISGSVIGTCAGQAML